MRRQTKSLSRYYVRRYKADEALTVRDIAGMLEEEAGRLSERIRRSAVTLRGSSVYWGQRARDLKAMVRQLGTPAVFFTFSAADIQWPDLQTHMPLQPSREETDQERQRRGAINLNENPAIAAWWFQNRFQLYLKHVLTPLLDVVDHWCRYEWQHRGSSHVHGLLWCRNAPTADSLDVHDPASLDEFVQYWGARCTAVNPGADIPPATKHPSSLRLATATFDMTELAQLLNRVQRHTRCTTAYCLRRPKGSPPDAPLACRFKYPKDLQPSASIPATDTGSVPQFVAKRNDSLLNEYNPTLISGWRANMDFTPVSDRHGLLSYIAKYVSKQEVRSADFPVIMRGVCTHLDDKTRIQIPVQKGLSAIATERDWSAQEVCHLLLDCDLYTASREFTSLCLLSVPDRRLEIPSNLENVTAEVEERGWRDKYLIRAQDLEEVSLYTWFKRYSQRAGGNISRRRQDRIVQLWPPYAPGHPDSDGFQDWCRARLLLHHPHRDSATLDIRQDEEPWSEAYERCLDQCDHDRTDTLPQRQPTSVPDNESEFSDAEDEEEDRVLEDFHLMCREGRARDEGIDPFKRLGRRDIDLQHDWHGDANAWGSDGLESRLGWLAQQKAAVSILHGLLYWLTDFSGWACARYSEAN